MRVGIPVSLGERGCGEGGKEQEGFGFRVGILDERKSSSATSFALQTCVVPADAWASTSCVRGGGGFRGFVEREAWDRN
jgi:hypothetical protein